MADKHYFTVMVVGLRVRPKRCVKRAVNALASKRVTAKRTQRGRTTSRCPAWRLLLMGLALLLRNEWVWWHWEQLSTPRRGGRILQLNRLRFHLLRAWVQQGAEAVEGVRTNVSSDRPPPPALTAKPKARKQAKPKRKY